jgi:small basic protein
MTFRAFTTIMFGMTTLGFALGLVLGVYLHARTGNHIWAYLAVPIMGLGSGIAAYGTLRAKKSRKDSEDSNG